MNYKKIFGIVGILLLVLLLGYLIFLNPTKSSTKIDSSRGDDVITLNGNQIEATGSVSVSSTTATIQSGGTYYISGTLNDGEIVVDAKEEEVTLVLEGVDITSSNSAPIYVKNAGLVTIILEDGTTNVLTDSKGHSVDTSSEPDGVLFSKDDLILKGTGTLEIHANYADGIVCKDTLVIEDGTYIIEAVDDAIRGKDSVEIVSGTFTINAGGDGIKSTNDTDSKLGTVLIHDGTFTITSVNDAIQAETSLTIENGIFHITTTGNSNTDSAKGLKANTLLDINGGTYELNTSDDGIHSNGNITVDGGQITIDSKVDAIHGDGLVEVNGGTITIRAAEGIEATYVKINDGAITINATDDGINAGNKSNAYSVTIEINGGTIAIDMGNGDTDAIDSNGNIYVNGGTIDITAQSPFDYDGEAKYTAGTIIVNGVTTNAITNQMMGGMQGNMFSSMQGGKEGMQGRR